MTPTPEAQFGDSSAELIERSEKELLNSSANDNASTDSIPSVELQTPMALMRLSNSHPQLPNIQPHQHSNLFYLSLIEGRCRTQAAGVLNLPEHHPEVDNLTQHLFSEMTTTLRKAGVLPDEFAGQELSDLRRNYLSSFDTIIQNIAAKKTHFEGDNTYSSLFDRSNAAATNKDLLAASVINTNPFALQRYTMAPGVTSRLRSMSINDNPYTKQYKEECLIGKGGFGKVFKSFHILDGHAYAIKKVVMRVDGDLNPEEKAKQMMAEIRALSQLDHRNIVRYHHCWTEKVPAELAVDSSSEGSGSEDEIDASVVTFENAKHLKAGPSIAEKIINKRLARDSRHRRQVSRMQEPEDSIVFANSVSASVTPGGKGKEVAKSFFRSPSSANDSDDDDDNDNSSDSEDNVDIDQSIDNEYSNDTGYSKRRIPRDTKIVKRSAVYNVVLFIQMSLHPMSLEDYLWPEQQKDEEASIKHCYHFLPTARILLAILDGVDYIHRNKIVHRDLKPSNIMLSTSKNSSSLLDGSINISDCSECSENVGQVYITPHICDFGLVAEIQDPEVSDPSLATGGITLFTPPLPSTSKFPGPQTSAKLSPKDRLSALSVALEPVHSSGPGLSTRQPGTRFYVAPKSKKNIVCPKVDIYSLGVIALEMICKFNTKSERAFELGRLKDGFFPQGFEKHGMYSGIKSMLCKERDQRWGSAEVRKWLTNIVETEKENASSKANRA